MTYNKSYQPKKDSNSRETPQKLFDLLDSEFHFIGDMAATDQNTKCTWFLSKEHDALSVDWPKGPVFCNPPYSRGLLWRFVAKGREEAFKGSSPTLLLPASTSSAWWFKHVVPKEAGLGIQIRFIAPRIVFEMNGEPMGSGAMTPNTLVTFYSSPYLEGSRHITWWNWEKDEYTDYTY